MIAPPSLPPSLLPSLPPSPSPPSLSPSLPPSLALSSSANVCQEQNDPTYFHVDIFEEVLSNHTDVARQLSDAPFVKGQESDAPAFQFSGRGFDISGSHLTNTIKRLSCLVNEVTIYGSVYLRDSHSGGPLVVISYTGDREKPLWGLYLDALKDELTVVYR